MPFTDRQIQSLKPKERAYRVLEKANDRGFGVQVTPAGSKIFFQYYSINGKEKYFTIGKYPEWRLPDAREKSREIAGIIKKGIDPREEIARKEAEALGVGTVKKLCEYYIVTLRNRGAYSADNVERCLNNDIVNAIGNRAANSVETKDIVEILSRKGEARTQANRLRGYIHAAYEVGFKHDYDPHRPDKTLRFELKYNPVTRVPKDTSAERTRDRALSWKDIRTLYRAPVSQISLPCKLACMLMLCTGQRVIEITGSRRSEFDLTEKLWVIPWERIKTNKKSQSKRPHVVPLTDFAIDIIQQAYALNGDRGDFLFPSGGDPESDKPITISTLPNATEKFCIRAELEHFTPRDLRRTWKTLTGECGISIEIRDVIQNHSRTGVSAKHYDRYEYLTEKKEAFEVWGSRFAAELNKQ